MPDDTPSEPSAGGRRRGRHRPRGRAVEPAARDAVRALLGDRPRRADLLIEHLHLIQDAKGHLPATLLAALAEEMRLPMAAVWEVASFYAHFDLRKEDEPPPPPVTIRVCDSLSCAMAGAEDLLASLEAAAGPGVRVLRAPCMGACDKAPAVAVGHAQVAPAEADTVLATARGEREYHPPPPPDFAAYDAAGGYAVLRSLIDGSRSLESLDAEVEASGLRGLGGAGFPSHRKWGFVRAHPGPRHAVINADEGEPGTFKDRYWLQTAPHRVLEGALIAARAVNADTLWIYLRDEYPEIRQTLLTEIPKVVAAGLAPPGGIELRRGAGAYICGEESAMLESIEGKRGYPRHRPPFAAEVGLFGRPTLIHNVETVAWLPEIAAKGGAWFAGRGRNGAQGLRSFSVSGRVAEPGVKIAPAGITLNDLIAEFCGGMAPGHTLKAYLPGGASGGILPASLADLPLDFGTLADHGCFVGSHAVIVLSQADSVSDAALNLTRFFEDESCGQCTPCRCGTEKAALLMTEKRWDQGRLGDIALAMAEASICGLGHAAPNPMLSVLRHFPEEAG